jgi:serine/threonine-protein kinase
VLAEMLLLLGSLRPAAGSADEAVRTLEEATFVALRTRRDDVAAEAAAEIAATAGSAGRGSAEGERWADMAEALLDRIGEGQERVRAEVLQTRAAAREAADPAEALRLARQALVLRRRVLPPDHPEIGESLVTEAECMHRTGDDAGALAMSGQAIDLLAGAYGAQSPRVARALSNRGTYMLALGRAPEAATLFRDALARWEAQVGPDDPLLVAARTETRCALARAVRATGDHRQPDPHPAPAAPTSPASRER